MRRYRLGDGHNQRWKLLQSGRVVQHGQSVQDRCGGDQQQHHRYRSVQPHDDRQHQRLGDLLRLGTGTLRLGANSYSGNTVIVADGGGGTIETTATNSLGSGGNLQVLDDLTLTTVNSLSTGAVLAGSVTLIKNGPGRLTVSNTTTNNSVSDGLIRVDEGSVQMSSRDGLGGRNVGVSNVDLPSGNAGDADRAEQRHGIVHLLGTRPAGRTTTRHASAETSRSTMRRLRGQ